MAGAAQHLANYRDESFISKFPEPTADPKLRLFPSCMTTGGKRPAIMSIAIMMNAATVGFVANWRGSTTSGTSIPTSSRRC